MIEQTEDQKQAELAKQKAILDAQKASEMQSQKVQMQQEMQQLMNNQQAAAAQQCAQVHRVRQGVCHQVPGQEALPAPPL